MDLLGKQRIAFGLDAVNNILTVWVIEGTQGSEHFQIIRQLENVKDFDTVYDQDKLYVLYLHHGSSKVLFQVLQQETTEKRLCVREGGVYAEFSQEVSSIENIRCRNSMIAQTHQCAINTDGIDLWVVAILLQENNIKNTKITGLKKFEKFANLDGSRMELDDEYLIHRVFDYSPNGSQASFLNVYRLAHPKLHAQIPMDRQASVSNTVLLEQIKMGMEKSAIESAGNRHLQAHAPFFFRSHSKSGARILGAKADDSASAFYLYELHD